MDSTQIDMVIKKEVEIQDEFKRVLQSENGKIRGGSN